MTRIPAFAAVRFWPQSGRGAWLRSFRSLHSSGRASLYWGIKALQLPRGSSVWMPSFHCGVEVTAAIDAGCRVEFYRLGPGLAVSEDELERRLSSQRGPVLLIHYFGFRQPRTQQIEAVCKAHGCPLIEDCAHALFSCDETGQELGSMSTLAVYSLRKTLPVLDGGALRSTLPSPRPDLNSVAGDAWRLYLKAGVRKLAGNGVTELYRSLRRGHGSETPADNPADGRNQPESYRAPMFWQARMVASATNPSDVVARRRSNYIHLSKALRDIDELQPVWPNLQSGTCPLFLPVWTDRRDELQHALASRRIETFRFGASSPYRLDSAAYPEIASFRDRILCLPIHQDLGPLEMDYLARSFREIVTRKDFCAGRVH